MRICIIANRNAGSTARLAELEEAAAESADVALRLPERRGDALWMAEQAASENFDVVAAAGGDGTVNEVVNGLMRASRRPALAVIPLGTGNDFARMLDVPPDARQALNLIYEGRRRRLDLYRVESPDARLYGINAAAGGFSGKVDEAVTPEMKANWGPLAYLLGAAAALSDIEAYDVQLLIDEKPPETVSAVNVIVANGRTVAGGRRVAPLSNPEDGFLDVVIVRSGSMVELTDAAARLVAGGFLNSRIVIHRRARTVHVSSEPGMWFNVDGELLTNEPIHFRAVPGALEVVTGPEYRAVVEP